MSSAYLSVGVVQAVVVSLYAVDGGEQVVYWELISVAENRLQRAEAAAASGRSCTYLHNPMPLEENLPCNKEGDRGPPTEGYGWLGDDSCIM